MDLQDELTIEDIFVAQSQISGFARRTPLILANDLELTTDRVIRLKLENLQTTGSFKIRGAANKIMHLPDLERGRGIVTVSSGNHGRAVSFVAKKLGIRATVCVTDHVPIHKRDAIQRLGAEVVIGGNNQDEAEATARDFVTQRGMTFINPFDDPHVIAGQGTIGLEILEDEPQIDTVIVPTSGGGLISGIALALKKSIEDVRVIGVTMERGAAMYESVKAGKLIEVEEEETLADALMGGIGLENHITLQMCQMYVDELVLVSEEEIAGAMATMMQKHRLVVEGGGAVGVAAILNQKVQLGERVVVVISGGNVDLALLSKVVQEAL
jgi:threonine dehydratase